MAPLDLVIRYNAARGFEEAALELARRLFAEFDEAIDSLALIPVEEEDFALYLNGRLVRSQGRSDRPPQVADVRAALREPASDGGVNGARQNLE